MNQAQATDIPVSELLSQFDYTNPEHDARFDEVLSHARGVCPVPHTTAIGGHYIATTYEAVAEVLRDHETFSSTDYVNIAGSMGVRQPPLDTDPPIQHDYRKILNPFFHPKQLAHSEQQVRDIAKSHIGHWVSNGTCEFIDDFATPFVTDVLGKVVFNCEDTTVFRKAAECTERLVKGDISVYPMFASLMADFVESRRAVDEGGVVSAILSGEIGGRQLTHEEQVGVVQILFSGGLDTTKVAISDIVLAMVQNPDLENRLRTPGWEKATLDELLRYSSPIAALGRHATRDTVVAGQQLKAGDRILVHYSSANHDDAVYESPDELRFDRERNPHLAFGLGVHRCVGMHLARLQIRVAIEELLNAFTNVRLTSDAPELVRRPGISRVLLQLPIEFDRR